MSGLGFRISGLGFGLACKFKVYSLGVRVSGSGCRVRGLGFVGVWVCLVFKACSFEIRA